MENHPKSIGDVRGKGLMIGLELGNRENKEPMKNDQILNVFEDIKDMGVLVGKGGLRGNVMHCENVIFLQKLSENDNFFTGTENKTSYVHYDRRRRFCCRCNRTCDSKPRINCEIKSFSFINLEVLWNAKYKDHIQLYFYCLYITT